MDYAFFEQLSTDEAREYLDRYLKTEAEKVAHLAESLHAEGIEADFSLRALPGVLAWLAGHVEVIAAEPPADTPAWLRDSMDAEHGGFRDFTEDSREWVLRASYFLGEAFVREGTNLTWGIGRRERAEFHQPVVTGFRTDADLPVLTVAENLYLGCKGPGLEERARTVIATWREAI